MSIYIYVCNSNQWFTYLSGSNHAGKRRGTVEQEFIADGRQLLARRDVP